MGFQGEQQWNSRIIDFVKHHKPEHAFILYQKTNKSFHVYGRTFVALLKACNVMKDIDKGREIHAEIIRTKLLEKDVFIGSCLVDMYMKCGSMVKAQEVFDTLPLRSTVSWTALMAGYAENGDEEEALFCLKQMQRDGLFIDVAALVCGLKACSATGSCKEGRAIHSEILKKGFEKDSFVGSILVKMYAKCNCFMEVHEVFSNSSSQNVVSWNALIAALIEHGFFDAALLCIKQMLHQSVCPAAATFVCGLKACGNIQDIRKVREMHTLISGTRFLEENAFIGSALVNIYGACGFVKEAQDAFARLSVQDTVSWTALFAGFVEQKLEKEAIDYFNSMQDDGVSPDAVTLVCILGACSNLGIVSKGQELHTVLILKGLEKNVMVGNSIVDMYAKCGFLLDAKKVFDNLQDKTIVSWTALIDGYAELGHGEESLYVYQQMQEEGNSMDLGAFICILKACSAIGAVQKGQTIHSNIISSGFFETEKSIIGSSLVGMYARCGRIAEAQDVFHRVQSQDVVSWTTLLAGYAGNGCNEEVLEYLDQMWSLGVHITSVVLVFGVKACAKIGVKLKGDLIHADIMKRGLEKDIHIGCALVDMYAKCGLLKEAQNVFDNLQITTVISWTALLLGYAHFGWTEAIFVLFEKMLRQSIEPDQTTIMSVLISCTNAGEILAGKMFLVEIKSNYKEWVTFTHEHYICIVNMFACVGNLDDALAIIQMMPFQPSIMTWHSFMGLCGKRGNAMLAEYAFRNALQLNEDNAPAYICISNIYVHPCMQEMQSFLL